ncbi:apoptosis inhibitor 5 homolog [Lucilia cuprina]|uniref:apoptosis inhibitor 5 homolog n=1 Tax=Lucilia cuprina TaxID=7375 RepID=UPI001F05B43C|nr:apoptosis inhibitor 5 homolog [Lucilia cuprina]
MDNIEHLYKCYEILSDAGDKISEHVSEYKDILKAVKGSSKEKRLASQFIGKFFKHFPDLSDTAIDAQLDLCEDDDMQIRRQAIKDLPKLCQDTVGITAKVGDTLAQLLVLDDPLELQQVNNSLQTIIKMDCKGSLTGIFTQISNGDEPTRERCFKFIATKLFAMGPTIVTKEIEEFIIDEIKKILQDVTADEFHLCMNILGSTKLGTTITGHAELVNLAKEQAELNADIDAITIEDEIVERFIQCATHVMPYFSNTIKSTEFVVYVCDKLLPLSTWNMIATTAGQDQVQLRLLKVFAEMCTFCDVLDNATQRIDNIYQVLREYMPLPQLKDDEDISSPPPSFQFSHAECLLYAVHTLGKKHPDSLSFVNDADKLKDFRSRLQYLARGTQGYIKKLEEAVKGKSAEDLKSEENQLKLTALKTTSNISTLIRDLFHSPPSFKHDIQLSWVKRKNNKIGSKRHAPITFDGKAENGKDEEKKTKNATDQKIYSPPSGKYSAKVQNYGNNQNNRQRSRNSGGGGGGYRNRRNFKKY